MQKRQKSLLIVCSDAFQSGWGGATPRFFHMAKGLKAIGWNVSVLASKWPSEMQKCDAERAFPGTVIRTPFPSGPHPTVLDWKGVRMLYRFGCSALGYKHLFDNPVKGWVRRIHYTNFVDGLSPKPDVVWAVSFGGFAGLLAGNYIAAKADCPFLIEFQDPCPGPGKKLNHYQVNALKFIYQNCDGVVAVTQENASRMASEHPEIAHKIRVVHLSYEESNGMENKPAKSKFVFLHMGALYGGAGRNARNFVRALKLCFDRNPDLKGKLIFRVVGGWKGTEELRILAKKLSIPESVDIIDEVDGETALGMMNESDVLVIIKFADIKYNGQIPGKLFQYLGQRKPIIGVMGECEAADILRKSGLGVVHDNQDVDGIAISMANLFYNRNEIEDNFRPNEEFITQFSMGNTAKKINNILQLALNSSNMKLS